MASLLIKNGIVYDPINKIDGEVMDIMVKDGKIVESIDESKAQVIDASNKIVMAGGVDLHSHIVGPKVTSGRMLRVEDHYKDLVARTRVTRAGTGYSIPSTYITGYRYAIMGYTTVCEPANPPLKMLAVHDELNDIPMIDKTVYILFGNNWFVMEYLKEGKIEECAAFIAWILKRMKGYVIKIVNPGGGESWKWGSNIESLDVRTSNFDITPREIIRGLCKVNKLLNLPHPIHVHANMLGTPGNYCITLETMDCVRDLASDDRPIIHMTHIQFHSYGGSNWASLSSAADEIANYVNKNKHVTIDMGQITFTDTTTMTADGPFEYKLQRLTRERWINTDVEVEESSGIVPIHYRRNNYVHAVMWAIGLESALLIKDPWRVFMTTDHPNGGPFTYYPRVISWLMSKKARESILKKVPRMSRRRTNLEGIDREYSFYEIAIVTRAGTARILGLKDKGHLAPGADADIAIYDFNPKQYDPSRDYKELVRAFSRAAYTIKDGEIVAKDGEIVKPLIGRTFWVESEIPKDIESSTVSSLTEKFRDYYTVSVDNYIVPENYLHRPQPVFVKS
ncbi:MAG: formylmethanofuran dehydrogenase subunit A, partial [Nitrososphaerales archaeon]|nr:formylmethanofuran dehydrogenase subunit A [Nitrososphaerales archaeon]